jgi:undecaprenyl diphosphate synthase
MLKITVPEFIRRIYEKKLEGEVKRGKIPSHIMIVTDSNDAVKHLEKLRNFVEWCFDFGIEEISLCVSLSDGQEVHPILKRIEGELVKIPLEIALCTVTPEEFSECEGKLRINLIVGYGGRREITDAIKKLAEKVEKGELDPEEVSERDIENHLKIKSTPDLVIKAGEDIPEFLIWQSIYSELYFLDSEWGELRYIDFLRCLRGYQQRERRFGK